MTASRSAFFRIVALSLLASVGMATTGQKQAAPQSQIVHGAPATSFEQPHCANSPTARTHSGSANAIDLLFGRTKARTLQDREPRCCGQCSIDGRNGCLVNTNGTTYCSAC